VENKVVYDPDSKYKSLRGDFTLGVTRPDFVFPTEVEERDDGCLIRRYNDRRKVSKDSESIKGSQKPV
jgi:hypothetical protein